MMAIRKCLVVLLAALPTAGFSAGKYTWFDDAPDGAPAARPSAFGAELYRSAGDGDDAASYSEHRVSVYGDYAPRASSSSGERLFANFGVRWQHRVSPQDRFAVSAQQGESVLPYSSTGTTGAEALDTRATFSWTRELPWSWRPSITGGVFLGDESARDETAYPGNRRYYGITVGGEMKLLQTHTPYVSLRMERSLYDLPEGSVAAIDGTAVDSVYARSVDDSSRLSAGWRWQVQRGWSMQAEASYGFHIDTKSPDLIPQDREGSRVFFGTRFDFK